MGKIDTEILHKEIDLIQGCITRMAHNSFLIKGWAVSIVAVVLALVEKAINPAMLGVVLLIPLISFWYLDAFFLYTEKLYRKLYEWVIKERLDENSNKLYDLNPHRFKKQLKVRKLDKKSDEMVETDKQENVWTVMCSKTLRCFYGIPTFIIISIILFQVAQGVITCDKNHAKPVVPFTVAEAPEQAPAFVDGSKSNGFPVFKAPKK
jgi:hypothetical protein